MPRARSRRSSSVAFGLALERRRSISVAFAGSRSRRCSAQAELHVERDELLLHSVVDVALELAPLGVLRGHQPLARRT